MFTDAEMKLKARPANQQVKKELDIKKNPVEFLIRHLKVSELHSHIGAQFPASLILPAANKLIAACQSNAQLQEKIGQHIEQSRKKYVAFMDVRETKCYSDLSSFREDYDHVSALVQCVLGVTGACTPFNALPLNDEGIDLRRRLAKALRANGDDDRIGTMEYLVVLLDRVKADLMSQGVVHLALSVTPWKTFDAVTGKKTSSAFYAALQAFKDSLGGSGFTFEVVVTIIKHVGPHQGFLRKFLNVPMVADALRHNFANVMAGKSVLVNIFGSASNERPLEESKWLVPSGEPEGVKKGEDVATVFTSIIQEAKDILTKEVGGSATADEALAAVFSQILFAPHVGEEKYSEVFSAMMGYLNISSKHGQLVRLGHMVQAVTKDATEVMGIVAKRGITAEVCPSSNKTVLSTCVSELPVSPFISLMLAGVKVTLNSDDVCMFGSGTTDTATIVKSEEFPFAAAQLDQFYRHRGSKHHIGDGQKRVAQVIRDLVGFAQNSICGSVSMPTAVKDATCAYNDKIARQVLDSLVSKQEPTIAAPSPSSTQTTVANKGADCAVTKGPYTKVVDLILKMVNPTQCKATTMAAAQTVHNNVGSSNQANVFKTITIKNVLYSIPVAGEGESVEDKSPPSLPAAQCLTPPKK